LLSSFIGRERERAEVPRLLSATRLLTLTGTAGVGKTRLALEVASGLLESFADGVWLVDLAPLGNGDLVPQAVASALGVREQPGRPLVATLADALRHSQLLLILDNCEHLVVACAALTNSLLRVCPRLQVLATSREALRLTGETTWRVVPLSLPEVESLVSTGPRRPAALMDYDAVRLFVARTQAVLPDFQLTESTLQAVASVCRQLDGLPLALELAAARVPGLGVEQLARRLDNRFRVLVGGDRAAPPRQQTLRGLVDWGYALLSEPQRVLLRRLSVFSDGWTLDAAEGICAGDGLDVDNVLPLLLDLVERSHVILDDHAGHARYRLLETLRQHGAEKLRQAGEEPLVRLRHLEWFALLAEQAEELLWGPDQQAWFDRLRFESNNLAAAMEWSELASDCPDQADAAVCAGLRLGGALWHFWDLQGYLSDGRSRLLALLRTSTGNPAVRTKAFHAAAYLTFVSGNAADGSRLAAQAVALGHLAVDPFLRASALVGLALGNLMAGDAATATAQCQEGLEHCRLVGERRGMYYALYGLAEIARAQGDIVRAVRLMEEAHGLTLEQADSWSIAFALSTLGNLTLMLGDLARAQALHQESLGLRYAIHDWVGIGRCLDGLGWVASALGQPTRAGQLFGAADALRERVGAAPHPLWQAEHARHRAATRMSLGEEGFAAALTEGRALELGDVVARALATVATAATPGRTAKQGPAADIRGPLSPREREVAVLVAHGYTNRAIADTLVITERTAEGHVERIRGKLGFSSRAQVAAWVVERRLAAA
jgi:non-specific serine/threonine protein kinase